TAGHYLTIVRYMDTRIARIREFNRVLTRRLGLLDGSFLSSGISLGNARVLYEIANGTTEVQRLRANLDLDSGQLSRMLRALETQQLVATSVAPRDGRARVLRLTAAGRGKLRELERKMDADLAAWLAPLSAARQVELQQAMAEVVRLLHASEVWIRPASAGGQ